MVHPLAQALLIQTGQTGWQMLPSLVHYLGVQSLVGYGLSGVSCTKRVMGTVLYVLCSYNGGPCSTTPL
jgi:hypothetical protein